MDETHTFNNPKSYSLIFNQVIKVVFIKQKKTNESMKYFLLFGLMLGAQQLSAQKYVLLDTRIIQPATYSTTITSDDKFNGFFPVEKKNIKPFIKALEEIVKELSSTEALKSVQQFEIGCVKFAGVAVPMAKENRLDYVITSSCDNVKISMHLCDAKISNRSNIYFINTWIKYIKTSVK
jgi:hypothetical protein